MSTWSNSGIADDNVEKNTVKYTVPQYKVKKILICDHAKIDNLAWLRQIIDNIIV